MDNGRILIYDASPTKEARVFSANVAEILQAKAPTMEYPQGKEDITSKFKDGETDILLSKSMRDADVYLFQSYIPPLGEREKELQYLIDACRGGGDVHRATLVLPYCFGMRGDRRSKARQPIPALAFAVSVKAQGAHKVITIGEHTPLLGTIYSAVRMGYDHLDFGILAANYIINDARERGLKHAVIATPDLGAATRNGKIQEIVSQQSDLETSLVIGNKFRPERDKAKITRIVGDTKGQHVYLADDIGDTLGSITVAVDAYKNQGPSGISVILNHPVLGDGYEPRLDQLCDDPLVESIVFGNTQPLKGRALDDPKVKYVPLEPFVAEAIWRINKGESISGLHKYKQILEVYQAAQLPQNGNAVRIK